MRKGKLSVSVLNHCREIIYALVVFIISSCTHMGSDDCDVYLLFACLNSNAEDIDVSDSTQFYMLELNLSENETLFPQSRIRINSVAAEVNQTILPGSFIRIQNTSIGSSTDSIVVNIESELKYVIVDYGGKWIHEGDDGEEVMLLSYLGLSYFDLDMNLNYGNTVFVEDPGGFEFYFQFGLMFDLTSSLDTGITIAFFTSDAESVLGSHELELFARYELSDRVDIIGGVRDFKYKFKGGELNSDIDISFMGPFLGVGIGF